MTLEHEGTLTQRAKALLVDVEENNPKEYRRMKKRGNPVKETESFIETADRKAEGYLETLLRQIPEGLSPMERAQAESEAYMTAMELEHEELASMYR